MMIQNGAKTSPSTKMNNQLATYSALASPLKMGKNRRTSPDRKAKTIQLSTKLIQAQNDISVHRESSSDSSCMTGDFDAVDDEKDSGSFGKNGKAGGNLDSATDKGSKKEAIASKLHTYQTAHKPSMGQINSLNIPTVAATVETTTADTKTKKIALHHRLQSAASSSSQ